MSYFLLGTYLRMELLGHTFCFFKELPNFSKVAAPFFIPPTSRILSKIVTVCPSDYSHDRGCEVVSKGGFDLHFPNGQRS